MKDKKIIIFIIAFIIIIGMILTLSIKLNVGLDYAQHKRIGVYVGKEFELKDMKNITREVFGKKVKAQRIEVFNDMAILKVRQIEEGAEEEKLTLLAEKINEKYGTEYTYENFAIEEVSNTKLSDIVKPYILPVTIAVVIILAYQAVRYRKLELIKILLSTLIVLVVVGALYVSILAITRIPVGIFTVPVGLVIIVFTLFIQTYRCEKLLEGKKENKK